MFLTKGTKSKIIYIDGLGAFCQKFMPYINGTKSKIIYIDGLGAFCQKFMPYINGTKSILSIEYDHKMQCNAIAMQWFHIVRIKYAPKMINFLFLLSFNRVITATMDLDLRLTR